MASMTSDSLPGMSAPSRERGRTPGARERNREALRRCALEHFARDGFEHASVARIAADAGVSERTFFRHFSTKEAVLFDDFASRLGWFRAALEVRPESEPLLDSVRVAVESYPDDREVVRQVARLRARLLPDAAIAGQLRRIQGDFAAEIERRAAARLGDRPGARLTAAVLGNAIAGALLAALRVFGESGARNTDALRELTRDALELLRHPPVLATGPRRRRRRPASRSSC
jgi:AcrR family transcriptional regulator